MERNFTPVREVEKNIVGHFLVARVVQNINPWWILFGLCLEFQGYQSGPLGYPMTEFMVKGILVIVHGLSDS